MMKKDINIKIPPLWYLYYVYENRPDVEIQSSDVIKSLESYGIETSIYDPWANEKEVKEYGLKSTKNYLKKGLMQLL